MLKILGRVFVSCVVCASLAFGGGVSASVDTTRIKKGEQVVLSIEASGKSVVFPTLSTIGGYSVASQSKSTSNSLSFVNGSFSVSHNQILQLAFFPEKSCTIEPIAVTVDSQKLMTKAIRIEVDATSISPPTTATNSDIALALQTSKKVVYEGEPFVVSMIFSKKSDIQLIMSDLQPPRFDGFNFKQIGSQKTTIIDGRDVTRIDYQLTPQKSGNLIIEPASVDVVSANGNFFDNFFSSSAPKHDTITSNALDIAVKALPAGVDLIGDVKANATLSKTIANPNTPVIYTLTIRGAKNAQNYDGLDFKSSDYTLYKQKPKITQEGNATAPTFIQEYAFVSGHSFTIPSKNIKVLDLKSGMVRTITLPIFSVKVEGALDENSSIVTSEDESSKFDFTKYLWILYLLGGGILVVVVFLWGRKNISKNLFIKRREEPLNILLPHIKEDSEVENMVEMLYRKKRGDKSIKIDKKRLDELLKRYKIL